MVLATTPDKQPLLSWRVLIAEYLPGSTVKAKDFKLDEPWDSEHNKKLLDKMPDAFKVVGGDAPPGHTYYRGFAGTKETGPTAMPVFSVEPRFGPGEPPWVTPAMSASGNLNRWPDGTLNTLMVVEAADAVPWTKPEELPYDGKLPLPKLGNPATGHALAVMASADPRILNTKKIDEQELRAAITVADGKRPTIPGFGYTPPPVAPPPPLRPGTGK